jgi:hypothetical protein
MDNRHEGQEIKSIFLSVEYIGGYLLICKDIFRYDRIYEGLWTTKKTDLSFGSIPYGRIELVKY